MKWPAAAMPLEPDCPAMQLLKWQAALTEPQCTLLRALSQHRPLHFNAALPCRR